MEVQRLGVKFFLEEPAKLDLAPIIETFHKWIQKQEIPGHLLIDVHNYSHIHQGPGILLVAHEGNFSLDLGDGLPGLLYMRKQPLEGEPEDRFRAIVRTALQACQLLEKNLDSRERLSFRTEEFLVLLNDRLNGPRTEERSRELSGWIGEIFRQLPDHAKPTVTEEALDPRERLTLRIRFGQDGESRTIREFFCGNE